MPTATTIKLESPYKGKPFPLISNVLLAIVMGPFIIFMMAHTAVANNVTDPLSWIIGAVSSLLFVFLSYSKFKYIYYMFFKEHTAEINYQNRSILFLPYKETVLIENVTTFVYRKKYKSYVFTYSNLTNTRFELKRNEVFENALRKFSLECTIE